MPSKLVGTPAKQSASQTSTTTKIKGKIQKCQKLFWVLENDPMRIEVAPFAIWFLNQPLWLYWKTLITFFTQVLNGLWGVLLPILRVLPSAADADVVLLLCHFWRDAHAHLVEPLVAAAIALDPIHLMENRYSGVQRRTKQIQHSLVIFQLFIYLNEYRTGHFMTGYCWILILCSPLSGLL